jgi:hypothetical protein
LLRLYLSSNLASFEAAPGSTAAKEQVLSSLTTASTRSTMTLGRVFRPEQLSAESRSRASLDFMSRCSTRPPHPLESFLDISVQVRAPCLHSPEALALIVRSLEYRARTSTPSTLAASLRQSSTHSSTPAFSSVCDPFLPGSPKKRFRLMPSTVSPDCRRRARPFQPRARLQHASCDVFGLAGKPHDVVVCRPAGRPRRARLALPEGHPLVPQLVDDQSVSPGPVPPGHLRLFVSVQALAPLRKELTSNCLLDGHRSRPARRCDRVQWQRRTRTPSRRPRRRDHAPL